MRNLIILYIILTALSFIYSKNFLDLITPVFIIIAYSIKLKSEQKIKQDSEQYIYVTKLQYDMEFKIYCEISEKLFKANVSVKGLAPMMDQVPKEKEALLSEYRKRYTTFVNSYNNFSETFTKYIPFYEKEIYIILDEIRTLFSSEGIDFEIYLLDDAFSSLSKFPYKESRERKKNMEIKIEELNSLIRNRLNEMKIR